MAASAISFKSIGRSANSVFAEKEAAKVVVPIGIRTPLRLGSTSLFEMNTDLFDQIRDNLRNLVMTNRGERLCLVDFGASLNEMSTERTSREDYDQEVAQRITTAVSRWMPYVSLDELIPLDKSDDLLGQSRTNAVPTRRYMLTYEVPSINSTKQSLEIIVGLA